MTNRLHFLGWIRLNIFYKSVVSVDTVVNTYLCDQQNRPKNDIEKDGPTGMTFKKFRIASDPVLSDDFGNYNECNEEEL